VRHGQLNAFLSQSLKLLATFHRLAQLLGTGTGDPLGMVFTLPPDLVLKIGSAGMVRVGTRAKLGLEGAVLHLINPGHLLEDRLPLLDEFAHEQLLSSN
jgi:hypothetical protein